MKLTTEIIINAVIGDETEEYTIPLIVEYDPICDSRTYDGPMGTHISEKIEDIEILSIKINGLNAIIPNSRLNNETQDRLIAECWEDFKSKTEEIF